MSKAPDRIVLAGRYRLLRPIGTGGMGTVWRAHDDMLDRPVAVKEVLLPAGLDDEARQLMRRRTMREARAAARLRHPAIVTIYDVIEHDDQPWIVMELVEGQSLAEALRSRGSLSVAETAGIALRVLDALITAQASGVQHRDVKPANVLLGEHGRIVLTDFGIARNVGDETLTSAGQLIGSPDFLAPERARGRTAPGLQSDLWSLGAMVYVMVEGRPPFQRNGPLPTLAAVVMDEPPAPRRAGPLAPLIDGLLIKDPAFRLDADRTRALLQRALRTSPSGTLRLGAADHVVAPPDLTRPLPVTRPDPAGPAVPAVAPDPVPAAGTTPTPPAAAPRPDTAPAPAPAEPTPAAPPTPAPAEPATPRPDDAARPAASPTPTPLATAVVEPEPPATPTAPTAAATVAPPPDTASTPPAPATPTPAPAEPAAVRPDAAPMPAAPTATVRPATEEADRPASAAVETESPAARPTAVPAPRRPTAVPAPDDRDRNRRGVLAAVLAAVAVLAVLAVLVIPRALRDDPPVTAASSPTPSAAPTDRQGTGGTAPGTGAPSATAASPSSTTPPRSTPAPSATSAVPAGFTRYRDPARGFQVTVPAGWQRTQRGSLVDFRDPGSSRFLRIDTTDNAQPDPYANWVTYAATYRRSHPGYSEIDIRRVTCGGGQAWTCADWEFRDGGTHVVDRNVRISSQRAHAIYWSTPERLWGTAESRRIFDTAAATFVPAPVG